MIAIEDDRPYDVVRDALAELGLPLIRMEQRRHGLEDLFTDEARAEAGGTRRTRRPHRRAISDDRHDPEPGRIDRADDGLRPRREHLRPRLPGLRGSAARPAERRDRALHQHAEGVLRDRPWRPGEDRAAGARRPHDPPRDPRGRVRGDRGADRRRARGRLAGQVLDLQPGRDRVPDAVLRGAGARAVRPRPALPRAAAVLLAGDHPRPTTRSPRSAGCSSPCWWSTWSRR